MSSLEPCECERSIATAMLDQKADRCSRPKGFDRAHTFSIEPTSDRPSSFGSFPKDGL